MIVEAEAYAGFFQNRLNFIDLFERFGYNRVTIRVIWENDMSKSDIFNLKC